MNPQQRRRQLLKFFTGLPMLASGSAFASKPFIYTPRSNNFALEGYDAVSYFNHEEPLKGSKTHSVEHLGATWLFDNEANAQAFRDAPDDFMPQFGGYCAFSVARGRLVRGDATLYAVKNDKLYVNYNRGVHLMWLKRSDSMISKAKGNWPKVLSG